MAHDWPKLDEGGLQVMEMWLDEHPAASLLIIDVWKRLRNKRVRNANLYDEDYEHLVPLQAIARRWWCRSLYRATRGQRRCPECTKS